MDNICGQCRHFGMYRLEPTCTKKMKPAGYFDEEKCFENKITMKDNQTNQEPSRVEESCAPADVATKICKGCHRELPIEQFGRHYKAKDGRLSYCKECWKIMTQKKNPLDSLVPKGPTCDPGDAGEDARDVFLRSIPDHMLINELAQRGWRGRLTIERVIIVGKMSQEA